MPAFSRSRARWAGCARSSSSMPRRNARLHQRFDLVLCPTVPNGPPLADAVTNDPVQALWTQWAPWTFTFNMTRQPAITVPLGQRANGLPNSVQLVAAQ